MRGSYAPGRDAKAIAEVACRRFGRFKGMFEHHGWPKCGSGMMPRVQTRVVETYGGFRAFEHHFQGGCQT